MLFPPLAGVQVERVEQVASQVRILTRTRRHIAKTADRSVTGVMPEFAQLAEFYRADSPEFPELAARLAGVPRSPLYKRTVRPDHEFDALLRSITTADGRGKARSREALKDTEDGLEPAGPPRRSLDTMG